MCECEYPCCDKPEWLTLYDDYKKCENCNHECYCADWDLVSYI